MSPLFLFLSMLSLQNTGTLQLDYAMRRVPRFEDIYACYIISDAEVSGYDDDEFEQVDYEELMNTIRNARYVHVAFEPAWQVCLYDDDGVRYRLYVSRYCNFFRIDSNYFQLSRRNARRLRQLFSWELS